MKLTPFASLVLSSILLLGSTAVGQTQKWAPMPVPAGTVVPVNSHIDSQGNTYAIGTNTVEKTTPAGVTTVIATAHLFTPRVSTLYDYYFSDLAVDSLDNVYVAETANGLGMADYQVELILKITPAGTITTFIVVDGSLRVGRLPNRCTLTVNSAGNLYTVGPAGSIFQVKADGSVVVVAPDAWFSDVIGSFNNPPQGLTSDENGILYTTVNKLNVQTYFGPLEIRPLTTAPLITFQPQGGTVAFGSGRNLSVIAAVDGGPLSYQWYRDGIAIDGASGVMQSVDAFSGTNLMSNSFSAGYGAFLPGTYTVVVSTGDPLTAVTSAPAHAYFHRIDASGTVLSKKAKSAAVRKKDATKLVPCAIALPKGRRFARKLLPAVMTVLATRETSRRKPVPITITNEKNRAHKKAQTPEVF